MLTGLHVLFIGGDARQIEVIRKFSELDAVVTLLGFEQWEEDRQEVTRIEVLPESLNTFDVLILPATGVGETGEIPFTFSSKKFCLEREKMDTLPAHATVFVGVASDYLLQMSKGNKWTLVELFGRDDLAIYNSIPTAEGAIMMAMQNTMFTLHGSNSVVLGLGRVGFTLARTLQGLGAVVKVGVHSSDQFARAWESRFHPFYTTQLAQNVTDADLIFNTIPANILTSQVITHLPKHAVIIDLASKPGGTDFEFAASQGIQAILAPGLPGLVAPQSAGRMLAGTIIGLLLEGRQGKESARNELEK